MFYDVKKIDLKGKWNEDYLKTTITLLNCIPKEFRNERQEELILEILGSTRSLEDKQVLLLKRAQTLRLDEKTAALKPGTLKTFKAIENQIAGVLGSEKHQGKPYFYLFKSWFGDDNKKQLLSELMYSMSQLVLKREEMSHQSLVYWAGRNFLAYVVQMEKYDIEKVPNIGPEEIYFRGSIFKAEDLRKLVGRRIMALGKHSSNTSLSSADHKAIREEVKYLKKIMCQPNESCSAKGIADYGFVTWLDIISLGDVIVKILVNANVIRLVKRHHKPNLVQLTESIDSIYPNIGLEYATVLPFINCDGFDITESSVTWKDGSGDTFYEEPLIDTDYLKQPSVSQDLVKTLNKQVKQPFTINAALLYKVLETPDNLEEALMAFLSTNEDIVACRQYRDVHEYLTSLPKASKTDGAKRYKQYQLKTSEFFILLRIAILFRNYELYFPVCLDFRARLYTLGWPLNPQGNKSFARKLLGFLKSSMCENDAAGQCVQLWSLLSSCKLGLQYTGLVHIGEPFISRDISPDKPDLYQYLANQYGQLLEKEISSWNFFRTDFKEQIQSLVRVITVRKTVKRMVVSFFFGEGRTARAEYIRSESIRENLIYSAFDSRERAVLKFSLLLEKVIEQEFSEIIVFQSRFKALVKEIQSLKGTKAKVNLSWHPAFSFTNAFYSRQPKRVGLDSRMLFRPNTFDSDGNPVLDYNKFATSLLTNFLHCGDAMLVQFVLEAFHSENLHILTIHDAFYTCKEHTDFANTAYIQAIKKLFADDPIRQIVSINDLKWSDISKDLQVYFERKHRDRTFFINRELKATDVLVIKAP